MRLHRHLTPTLRCLLAAFLCISTSSALAEPINYQQVSLNAEARREINNDLMTATLFIEQDDKDPARLADQINRKINEALALGKEFKTVKLRSSGRNTDPLYTAKNRADTTNTGAVVSSTVMICTCVVTLLHESVAVHVLVITDDPKHGQQQIHETM